MGGLYPHLERARRLIFQTAAYVHARVLRRDYRAEIERLEAQSRGKSYVETALTMAVLMGLAFIAARFGWVGMSLYFLAILILF